MQSLLSTHAFCGSEFGRADGDMGGFFDSRDHLFFDRDICVYKQREACGSKANRSDPALREPWRRKRDGQ